MNIILLLIGLVIGNISSQAISGKHEGDQSRMKSIIIPISKTQKLWVHHWTFYIINLIILLFAYYQQEYIFKYFIVFAGAVIMFILLALAKLVKSIKHLILLFVVTTITMISLSFDILFFMVVGSYIGIILHGLSYKDRFDFIHDI